MIDSCHVGEDTGFPFKDFQFPKRDETLSIVVSFNVQ